MNNAFEIFGLDIGGLKGGITCRPEPEVQLNTKTILDNVTERHQEVTIEFQTMLVCDLPFAVSICRPFKFDTVEVLPNCKADTLSGSLKQIRSTFAPRGFNGSQVKADNEFSTLEVPLSAEGKVLNVVSREEHEPDAERHFWTLKARCRVVYVLLLFRKIPSLMVVELAYCANFWLHKLPAEDGVSEYFSSRKLVSGFSVNANKHCECPFS